MASTQRDVWTLGDLCTPWCIHVAVTLRIAERIAGGTTDARELAAAAGADPESLQRVLTHLAGHGVFDETSPGRFALNDTARGLLESGVRLAMDLDGFGGRMAHAWGTLLRAVRTGAPAYQERFGRPFWDDLRAHPDIAADFDDLMGPPGHGAPDPNVLIAGDWDQIRSLVDVGGGTGSLLAAILRAHPGVTGTLVDLAGAVARSGAIFSAADVADRATAIAQSFFDPLPAGADLYLLKSVMTNWPDADAIAILQRCADAARPAGRIVVLGGVALDDAKSPPPALLEMVLIGGKERTLAHFRQLAAAAGLSVEKAGALPSGRIAVECRPTR